MENKALIDYVKNCYELEKSVYLQTEVIKFYEEKLSYFNDYQSRFMGLYNERITIPREYDIYSCINPNYKNGLYTGCSTLLKGWEDERPHSPDEVIIYINATRNMKFGFFESDYSKAKKKLLAYNNALAEANNDIRNYNNNVQKESLQKAQIIGTELRSKRNCLYDTKRILQSFYEKDIVFAKYRTLPAMSAILEYLVSGRCKDLPSAYNKYEEEVRQAIIIDKLEKISNKLERIEKNQYMLYDAIMTVAQKMDAISSGVNAALSSMTRIEENTAISAYNSKIIADNEVFQSKLLAFDVTYRLLQNA